MSKQKKDLTKLKTGQLKLSRFRSRKIKKSEESWRNVRVTTSRSTYGWWKSQRRRERDRNIIWRNNSENFQEAQQTPSRINSKRTLPTYIVTTLLKEKEKILKHQEGSNLPLTRRSQEDCQPIHCENPWNPERRWVPYLRCRKKTLWTQKPLPGKTVLQTWERNGDISTYTEAAGVRDYRICSASHATETPSGWNKERQAGNQSCRRNGALVKLNVWVNRKATILAIFGCKSTSYVLRDFKRIKIIINLLLGT